MAPELSRRAKPAPIEGELTSLICGLHSSSSIAIPAASWLLTILHNTFRNQHRAERRSRGDVDIDDPATALEATEASGGGRDLETLVLSETLDQEIVEALGELPEEFRSVIVLVDLQELTYEQAAAAVECPIGTVRSRLSRGRHLLAQKLAAYARGRGYRRKSSV